MRKIFLCLGLMSALPLAAQVAISASDVTDSSENAVPLARLCFTPVNANAAVSGFRVGSNQVIPNEVCGTITTGALQSGLTLAPTPTGIGYHVYVKASNSNNVLRDDRTVPITGSTWTLDTLDCPSAGPLPTSTVVTSVNGNSGAFDLVGSGVSCATVSGGGEYVHRIRLGWSLSTKHHESLQGQRLRRHPCGGSRYGLRNPLRQCSNRNRTCRERDQLRNRTSSTGCRRVRQR